MHKLMLLQMSVPFIPIQEITIGRCLGEGSEGVVYAGSYLETPVAIKQLSHVQEMEMNLHIGALAPAPPASTSLHRRCVPTPS